MVVQIKKINIKKIAKMVANKSENVLLFVFTPRENQCVLQYTISW